MDYLSFYIKFTLTSTLAVFMLFINSCNEEPIIGNFQEVETPLVNPNISEFFDCCENNSQTTNFEWVEWKGNVVVAGNPLQKFTIAENNEISEHHLLKPNGTQIYIKHFALNHDGSKLIYVSSEGALMELNITTLSQTVIRDQSRKISSARYMNGDDSQIIYFSTGDPNLIEAGYYLLDKDMDSETLLLKDENRQPYPSITYAKPTKTLNNFDISPDNNRLLIPLRTVYIDLDNRHYGKPKLAELNLETNEIDTLDVHFDKNEIWAKYNKDATAIHYSNYQVSLSATPVFEAEPPHYLFRTQITGGGESGIIDLNDLSSKILKIEHTTDYQPIQTSLSLSPDEQTLIFAASIIDISIKVPSSLYMLNNLDDPNNFKTEREYSENH